MKLPFELQDRQYILSSSWFKFFNFWFLKWLLQLGHGSLVSIGESVLCKLFFIGTEQFAHMTIVYCLVLVILLLDVGLGVKNGI